MSDLSIEIDLNPAFHDCDPMQVVWHGNYILYFETARTEALRACGGSYRDLEASGVMMPVVDVDVHYLKPAYYDDLLTIVVRIDEPPGARMTKRAGVRGDPPGAGPLHL